MRAWGHIGGATGYLAVEAEPITVESVWAGNVAATTAEVRARSADASAVTLRLSTAPNLSGYESVAGSEGTDEVWTFDLADLEPDTTYYYGFVGSDMTGRFRTFPTPGAAYSYGLAAASCAGHSGGEYDVDDVSNPPTFDRITDRLEGADIVGFVHMGDRHYRDINSNNQSLFQDAYHDVMAQPRQLAMHRAGWVAYQWNDHDFGPNDSHAGSPSKPAAQTVYRQHVPHWPLQEADSIFQTWVIGRTRHILLDDRSYRSQNSATDNSSKTMLGATQKSWLLDTVDNATEQVIVIYCGAPWNGNDSITWGVFSTERDELIAEFTSMSKLARLLMVHGDNHFLAADDGTNAPGGIPTLNLAGLDAGFTVNDGTWSEGIHKNEQQQYGTLHFEDDGSDITLTARGYSVNSSGVETERFEMVLPY